MSCCFVASRHSDKNLSNRLDYLSRLPFASLFIDNSWLITETVSNLQENQSSSWRRPRGCCHHAHLCSNAAHAYMLKFSNAHAQMLKCSNAYAQMSNFIQMLLMLFICAHAFAQILTLLVLQMLLMLMLSCMVQILVHVHLMLIFDALDSTVLVYAHPV